MEAPYHCCDRETSLPDEAVRLVLVIEFRFRLFPGSSRGAKQLSNVFDLESFNLKFKKHQSKCLGRRYLKDCCLNTDIGV